MRHKKTNHARLSVFLEAHWEHLWQEERYGDDYYYISQLYEQNWQPRVMA